MYNGLCLSGPLHGQIVTSETRILVTPVYDAETVVKFDGVQEPDKTVALECVRYEYRTTREMPLGVFILEGESLPEAITQLMKLYIEKDYYEVDNETIISVIEPATNDYSLSTRILKNLHDAGYQIVSPVGEPGQQPNDIELHREMLEAVVLERLMEVISPKVISNRDYFERLSTEIVNALKDHKVKISK